MDFHRGKLCLFFLLATSGCSTSVDGINPYALKPDDPATCPALDGVFSRQGTSLNFQGDKAWQPASDLVTILHGQLFTETEGGPSAESIGQQIRLSLQPGKAEAIFILKDRSLQSWLLPTPQCENGRWVMQHDYDISFSESTSRYSNTLVLRKEGDSLLAAWYQNVISKQGLLFTFTSTREMQGQWLFPSVTYTP